MADVAALNIRVSTLEAKQAKRDLDALTDSGGKTEKSMNAMTSAAKYLGSALAALGIASLAKDAVLSASRYETLGIVMSSVGNAAGYTAKQMNDFASSLQKQGISLNESRASLAKLALANIKLDSATRLATAAQGAAIIMGRSSSEAFEAMTGGIVSNSVERIRQLGIMADFEGAMEREARAMGKKVSQLTDAEKMQARVNEVLLKSKNAENVYAAAMETAGKQLGSMTRYLADLSVMLGSVGLEAFTVAVFGSSSALKDINSKLQGMMQDGTIERLGQGLISVGKAAWTATQAVGSFWLAWRATTIIESTMLTLGLLKLELRSLSASIIAAGGAWSYFNGVMASTAATMTTVGGIMTGLAAAFSGIMIGKYLVEEFEWAASASLSMGETIQTVWAKLIGNYKIGIASLTGDEEKAEKALASKLLTIRMTYLHERAEMNKRFSQQGQKKPWADELGTGGANANTPKPDTAAENKRLSAIASITEALAKANDVGDEGAGKIAELSRKYDEYAKVLGAVNPLVKQYATLIAFANAHLGNTPAEVKKSTDEVLKHTRALEGEIAALDAVSNLYGDDYSDALAMMNARTKAQEAYTEAIKKGADATASMAEQTLTLAKAQRDIDERKSQSAKGIAAGFSGPAYDAAVKQTEAQYELAKKSATDITSLERAKNQKLEQMEIARLRATGNAWDGAKAAAMDYAESATNAGENMAKVFTNAMSGMEDALTDFATSGKLTFSSLAESIMKDLVRMQIRAGLGSIVQSASSGGLWSSITGLFGFNHGGGMVGSPTFSQQVPLAAFAGAERFHSGGYPGLKSDEVPIIAQKGERVLSKAEVAAGASGGTQTVTVIMKDAKGNQTAAPMSFNTNGMREFILNVVRDGSERGLLGAM